MCCIPQFESKQAMALAAGQVMAGIVYMKGKISRMFQLKSFMAMVM